MDQRAAITVSGEGDERLLRVAGSWTVADAERLDAEMHGLVPSLSNARSVRIDLAELERLDTAGAWLVHRTARTLSQKGSRVSYEGMKPAHRILLEEVEESDHEPPPPRRQAPAVERIIVDTGETMIVGWRDSREMVTITGEIVLVLLGLLVRPWRMRFTSVIFHLEYMALRAVPIVALISFLIGGIILQQGAYQLRAFGAEILSVDLAGILVLREIGVLLTAIMVAGRSGSAITAEIGSMKMREEVDAMRTLALDPIDVLVVPRILALTLAMPLLTFVADMAALAGASTVAWIYLDLSPGSFISYTRTAVAMNTFLVGLIKAPFMAVVIGMIACLEGMKVGGSAESLGQRTTAAVVKAIFMVIVLDGIFAMLFAAIDY